MSKITTKKPAKVKKAKLEDYRDQFVTVYPTEKNTIHEKNVSISVHPDVAKHLNSKGWVDLEEPDGWVEKPETIDGLTIEHEDETEE